MAPRKKKVDEATPAPITESVAQTTGTVAHVYTAKGAHVRTYSKDIHGDEFINNAHQMAAQHPGGRVEVL